MTTPVFPPEVPMCARHHEAGCQLCDPHHLTHPMASPDDIRDARLQEALAQVERLKRQYERAVVERQNATENARRRADHIRQIEANLWAANVKANAAKERAEATHRDCVALKARAEKAEARVAELTSKNTEIFDLGGKIEGERQRAVEALRKCVEALERRRERLHAGEFAYAGFPDAADALASAREALGVDR